MNAVTMGVDRAQIENLLYTEARLLDERRFEEWLDLFTDDAVYWIPAGGEDPDPRRHVSLIYDDRTRLKLRIGRLRGDFAHSQLPPSRVYRMVGNVEIAEPSGHEVTVHAVLALFEVRYGKQTVYAARCTYRLRREDGTPWRIASKRVDLVNRDEVIDNLTFLV
jgi:3-phenylpropionate/cinnamic acid dioxygenase small subunit